MSNKLIHFEIVTPERIVLKESVKQVSVPTSMGEITVLPEHIPLVATLKPGVLHIKTEKDEDEIMSISGGFIEVLRDKVVVLADTAERAHEIDIDRAEDAKTRAERIKRERTEFDDRRFADVNARIATELARTKAVKRWKKVKRIETIQ